MISIKIRKLLVLALVAGGMTILPTTPARAVNPACVLNTDYTQTIVGDSVTLVFYNSNRVCDFAIPNNLIKAEIAIVGGGGSGGGFQQPGGGGAGQVLYNPSYFFTESVAVVSIGLGGAPVTTLNSMGNSGGNTSFGAFTSRGGGGGGSSNSYTSPDWNGRPGGSSGGSSRNGRTPQAVNGFNYSGWTSYGHVGGAGAGFTATENGGAATDSGATSVSSTGGGGGGGGAYSTGSGATATINIDSRTATISGGKGGSARFLIDRCLGGGGGGTARISSYYTGLATGGAASDCFNINGDQVSGFATGGAAGQSGRVNTGSGGGGNTAGALPANGAGGSGVVIIRYSTTTPTQVITFDTISAKTFNTSAFRAVAMTDAPGETVTVQSITPATCSYSGETVTLQSTGTCTLRASQPGSARFQAATSVTRSFQITRGTVTLGQPASTTKVYGNPSFKLETVTASVPGTFSFSSSNTSVISISGDSATIVGAGTTTIRLLFTPTESGKWESSTASSTVTVNKKSLTVTAPNNSVEFGSPRSSFSSMMSPTYSGFVLGETQSVLNIEPICVESETYTATTSPVLSPYAIRCSGGVDDNYEFTYISGSLTVTRNDLSEYTDSQLASSDRAAVIYGEVVTVTPISVGTFNNTVSGECSRESNWSFRATAASGICSVTVRQIGPNFESRTVVMNIPTVKRQLTVSGSSIASKSYDGSASTGVITPGTLGNLYGSDRLTLSASASAFANASAGNGKVSTLTYSISNGSSGLASNYLPPVDETVTSSITKARPTFNSWPTVTIALSASGESFTAPTVAAPVSGGVFTYSIASSAIATITGNAITAVSAGSTALTATFTPTDGTNYEAGSVSTTLTVSKGARTLSFVTTAYSKSYGDAPFTISATPSAGSGDGAITYSVVGSACSINAGTGLVSIVSAGVCSISATISTGVNYDQVSTTTAATVTISRKSLTISGSSIAPRTYSGLRSPGTLTVGTVSGLVLGESLTVTGSASTLSSANAGSYSTNVSYTLSNGIAGLATNYALSDESITATIQKKALRITASNGAVQYGGAAPTITPIYDGFVSGEGQSDLDTAPTCTSNYTNTSPSGSALVSTCSGAVDGNYTFTYIAGTITVSANSRTITLAISDNTLQYGETATLTATVSAGALDGVISYSTNAPLSCEIVGNILTAKNHSGTCQVYANISQGVNFSAVLSISVAVTLSPRELTVINSSVANKIYDGTDSATVSSASLLGVVSGDLVQLVARARFANKNVGSSKAVTPLMSLTGSDATHYVLIQPVLASANITKRTITISGLSVVNRNFDSSTVATISGTPILNGYIAGDSLTVSNYSTGTFANMGPGDGIAVTTNISLVGGDSSNYQLTQPQLVGDIPLVLQNKITLGPVPDKNYGDSPFLLTATSSSGLPVQVLASGPSCSILGLRVTITGVGVCELTAEQPGDGTYEAALPVIETFTVLAARVTLTIANQAIVAGSPVPTNSFTLSRSLVAGDQISIPSYQYSSSTYTPSSVAPSAIGVYLITIDTVTFTSGETSNYLFTIVNGTLSIGSASDKNLTAMAVFVPGFPSKDYLFNVFNPTKYAYSVLLPPSATTVRVTIGRSSISTFKSQVRINDSGFRTLKYSSSVGGTADSGDLPVPSGSNQIQILITALDKSILIYTISVFKDVVVRDSETVTSSNVETIVESRKAEIPTLASSAITGITFLPALSLTPTFSLTTYAYNATVQTTISSIIAIASFQGQGFTVKTRVNNGGFKAIAGDGRSQPMSLVKGSNQVFIRVQSGDGTVVVYTFTITRL